MISLKKPTIDFLLELQKIPVNLDRNVLLRCLEDTDRLPLFYHFGEPSVEIINPEGTKWHKEIFFEGAEENSEVLNTKLVQELYNSGYTLTMSRAGDVFKELKEFQCALNTYFNKYINVNIYAGTGESTLSFSNHCHDYGVIVRNVIGKSLWVFNDSSEVVFESSRVVYFEPEVNHYVKKVLEDRITLTCNIH